MNIKQIYIHKINLHQKEYINEWGKLLWKRIQLVNQHRYTWINIPIILFKSSDILIEYQDIDNPKNRWDLIPNLRLKIFSLPGNHDIIFQKENIEIINGILNSFIIDQKEDVVCLT